MKDGTLLVCWHQPPWAEEYVLMPHHWAETASAAPHPNHLAIPGWSWVILDLGGSAVELWLQDECLAMGLLWLCPQWPQLTPDFGHYSETERYLVWSDTDVKVLAVENKPCTVIWRERLHCCGLYLVYEPPEGRRFRWLPTILPLDPTASSDSASMTRLPCRSCG